MVLGYTYRFDKGYKNYKNVNVYSIVTTISLIFGGVLWMFLCLYVPGSVPFSVVNYPLLIAGPILVAKIKRDDHDFWYGHYSDHKYE